MCSPFALLFRSPPFFPYFFWSLRQTLINNIRSMRSTAASRAGGRVPDVPARLYKTGVQVAREAVDADNAREFQQALELYKKSAEFFVAGLRADQQLQHQKRQRQVCVRWLCAAFCACVCFACFARVFCALVLTWRRIFAFCVYFSSSG